MFYTPKQCVICTIRWIKSQFHAHSNNQIKILAYLHSQVQHFIVKLMTCTKRQQLRHTYNIDRQTSSDGLVSVKQF